MLIVILILVAILLPNILLFLVALFYLINSPKSFWKDRKIIIRDVFFTPFYKIHKSFKD